MNRTKIFNKVIVRGIEEVDFLHNKLSDFKLEHDVTYYLTDGHDVARPDLISFENYGTVIYWWVVLLVNGIDNPFTGIEPGMKLKIPSLLDIHGFQRQFKTR